MIDPFGEGEAPAEPVISAARREARPPDRNVAPEAAEGIACRRAGSSVSVEEGRTCQHRLPLIPSLSSASGAFLPTAPWGIRTAALPCS